MIVNIEVQFKALADLKGIKIEKGTKLMIAQGIKKDNNVSDQENVRPFVQEAPLQHVGGKLRIRLFRIDNVPHGCRTSEGGNIYVRVACGRLSNYGSKIDEKKKTGFVDTVRSTLSVFEPRTNSIDLEMKLQLARIGPSFMHEDHIFGNFIMPLVTFEMTHAVISTDD